PAYLLTLVLAAPHPPPKATLFPYTTLFRSIDPHNFVIDKDSNLLLGSRKIFLDNDGSAILNWYGANGVYDQVPMYKLIKVINGEDRKSTRLNSSHVSISYAVFCLKKKNRQR